MLAHACAICYNLTFACLMPSIVPKTIGVLARGRQPSVRESFLEVLGVLNELSLNVVLDEPTCKYMHLTQDTSGVPKPDLYKHCDLVIVVGGDGSILHAANVLAGTSVPVLGINRGRLGFLADVAPSEVKDALRRILAGEYILDTRFLLSAKVHTQDGILRKEGQALNDIILHPRRPVQTLDFVVRADGVDVYRQHSDGLIVATPTGSTAYALSGGGPLLHPAMDALCLVSMCPHTLSNRPLVLKGDSILTLTLHKDNRTPAAVSFDGHMHPIQDHDVITIAKSTKTLQLLHPLGFDFYEACRSKLFWHSFSNQFAL